MPQADRLGNRVNRDGDESAYSNEVWMSME